jgi:hypothetical protein
MMHINIGPVGIGFGYEKNFAHRIIKLSVSLKTRWYYKKRREMRLEMDFCHASRGHE